MISFSSLLPPGSEVKEEATAAARSAATAAVAADLRLALAMRNWVDPNLLLPKGLVSAERAKVLDAVAPDVQVALLEHPGQWFMRDQERRRFLVGMGSDQLEQAIAARSPEDAADPVRTALEMRRRPVPAALSNHSTEVLVALGSTFNWLDPSLPWQAGAQEFWAQEPDSDGAKRRVAATLARRRRRDDVERMTQDALRGRDTALDSLIAWANEPATGNGRFLYLSGIGGSGKSTLFAHLEKRLWSAAGGPLLVHIDCDMPGFDPTDPVALDLALFPQLAVAMPSLAPDMMRRAQQLSQATRDTDTAYLSNSGLNRMLRGRQRKAEADRVVESFVALESATSEKQAVRSSISDNALIALGERTVILLFDTAELMLARAAVETSSESAGTTEWLRSLTDLMSGYDVRVLMAGRNPPTDVKVTALSSEVRRLANWQVGKPLVLADLGEADAQAVLKDLGVEEAVAAKAAKVLPRTPLILKMAADVYRTESTRGRADFVARLDADDIDPVVARRYLTERIVSHLASPVARPYALAAMALPRVTPGLVEAVLLPIARPSSVGSIGVLPDGEAAEDPRLLRQVADAEPPAQEQRQVGASERTVARDVYRRLGEAGWLVRRDPTGQYLTFHPEVRRLALDLMASDPAGALQLEAVRRGARDYHARRRRSGDATFRAYYDVMLNPAVSVWPDMDLTLLGAAVDDLPAAAGSVLRRQGRHAAATPTFRLIKAWSQFIEGSGRRDGEGDRLVKRGHADAALKLYRGRPTRPKGNPPTFVLQALADGGYFHTDEVDTEAIVADLVEEMARSSGSLPNTLRSRIYWLTRFQLMARPGPLSAAHHAALAGAARRFSGSGPVLLFPSITSVAEAFAPEREALSPDAWFDIAGSIESETRMFLVHYLLFGRNSRWKPHVDALFTLQPDWPELALTDEVAREFERWMQQLHEAVFPPASKPGSQAELSSFLRRLRVPIPVQLTAETLQSQAILLLRGLTTEFHRPLRAAMTRHANSSPKAGAKLIAVTVEMLGELPLRTFELTEGEWERRAGRDISAALGLAIPYIDRARRLPSFCERLAIVAGRTKTGHELAVVAQAFLDWDKALSSGFSSDWSRLRA